MTKKNIKSGRFSEAAGAATNAIHSTGTTIKDGASSTVKWIGSWVGW